MMDFGFTAELFLPHLLLVLDGEARKVWMSAG